MSKIYVPKECETQLQVSESENFNKAYIKHVGFFNEMRQHPTKEEMLVAFNSAETIEDGLEEVFRLGQKHWLAK